MHIACITDGGLGGWSFSKLDDFTAWCPEWSCFHSDSISGMETFDQEEDLSWTQTWDLSFQSFWNSLPKKTYIYKTLYKYKHTYICWLLHICTSRFLLRGWEPDKRSCSLRSWQALGSKESQALQDYPRCLPEMSQALHKHLFCGVLVWTDLAFWKNKEDSFPGKRILTLKAAIHDTVIVWMWLWVSLPPGREHRIKNVKAGRGLQDTTGVHLPLFTDGDSQTSDKEACPELTHEVSDQAFMKSYIFFPQVKRGYLSPQPPQPPQCPYFVAKIPLK